VSIAEAITALFVPGNRPDRYAKAAAAGADVVIVDLEDAVPAGEKAAAREAAVAALAAAEAGGFRALVRVNDATSPHFADDVAALVAVAAQAGHGLLGIVLPKADDPTVLAGLATGLTAQASGVPLAVVALIESAAGLVRVLELAGVTGVTRLAFGALDLGLDLDADPAGPVTAYAAAQVVVASRAAGIAPPLQSPCTEIVDLQRVADAARSARAAGFGGQLCIHPAQVATVRAAFTPTVEQIRWARTVAEAADGASKVDGAMIDRPVRERARRILSRAEQPPPRPD
jgi:citrate lyase subunit beta/citryl-CoA lyase